MHPDDMAPDVPDPGPYYSDWDVALLVFPTPVGAAIGVLTQSVTLVLIVVCTMSAIGGCGIFKARQRARRAAWKEAHPSAKRFLP